MTAILYETTDLTNGYPYIGVDGKCDPTYLGSGLRLRRAIRKKGRHNFRRKDLAAFDTLAEAFEAEAEIVTQEWVDDPTNYNLCGGGRGRTYTAPETRAKISAANKGNQIWVGKKHSPESVAKMRRAKIGKKHTPEAKAKIKKAGQGRKHTLETRVKQSLALKGVPKSPEHRRNLSVAMTGIKLGPQSPEHTRKSAEARRGAKRTPETRAKMAEARRAWWRRKKETEAQNG